MKRMPEISRASGSALVIEITEYFVIEFAAPTLAFTT